MSTSGEEIKVLLTADLAGLQAGMTAATESVETSSAAITAAVEESASSVKAAHASVAESAEAAAERIRAMVRASLEQAASDQALAESERSLAERMGLRIEATDAQLDATAAAIAAQNEQMAGALAFADAEAEAAAATDAATVATDANTGAMVVNAGVAREVGVLMGELARGNTARLEGSLFTLGNRAGLTTMLFTPMGAAIAAAGAAVLSFGVAAVKGAEEQARFNDAILMTGGAAGVSSGAVQEMADRIGQSTGSFGDANEAMLAIVRSGRFTADQLQEVGQAAVQMSQLTGDSVEKSVQQFVKLQEKPVQAVVELNNQYHFLTASVFDQIEALQREGNVQQAAAMGQQALSEALAKRAREAEQQLNGWGKAWHKLGEEASWAWNEMKNLGKTDSVDQEIDKVSAKLTVAKNILSTLQGSSGGTGALIQQTQQVNDLTGQLNKLVQTRDKMREKDAEEAKNQAAQQKAIQDIAAQDKLNESLKYTSQLQQAIAEEKARVESIHKTAPGSASIQGIDFNASGAVAGGAQWDAIVAKLTKEYGEKLAPAIRSSGNAAREAAQEAANVLEMQRLGTQAATADRIQADARILASTRANSNEQRAALAQLLGDEKAYDAAVVKSREQALKKIEQDTLKNNEAIKKAYDQAYSTTAQAWHRYLDPINHAFQTTINGMIRGTQTFKQSMAHLLQSIEASFVQYGIRELEQYIINQQAKTAAAAAGEAERTAIQAAGAVQAKTIDAATGKSQITTAAATGAAKAYQAIVGIPYVGPILAPIAAGVAFAGIEAFAGSIASARGGWERVPFDGAMTVLHQDEMVLPKHVADPVRQMAKGGAQGGGMTVHLSSTDPRGFKDYLRRNPSALSDALKHAQRRGHFAGAMR